MIPYYIEIIGDMALCKVVNRGFTYFRIVNLKTLDEYLDKMYNRDNAIIEFHKFMEAYNA